MAWQTYINPAEAASANRFAPAPSVADSSGFDYGASARYMNDQNRIKQSIPGATTYNAPAAPVQSPLDQLYGEYKTQQDAAKEATLFQHGQAGKLLSLDSQGNRLVSDGPAPPLSAADQYIRDNTLTNAPVPTFAGASPSEAAVNMDAAKRGIFNTSSALNQANLGKTMDAFNANNATYDRTQRAVQSVQQQRELDRNRDERLRTDQVAHIDKLNHVGPDPALLAAMAMKYGAGTSAGLSPGAFSGGYGGGGQGAGSLGYGLPLFPNNAIQYGSKPTPKPQPKAPAAIQPRPLVSPTKPTFQPIGPKPGFPTYGHVDQGGAMIPPIQMPTIPQQPYVRPNMAVPRPGEGSNSVYGLSYYGH